MKNNIQKLRKKIKYRCTHTALKETDILYKKYILSKINKFHINDLEDILNLFKYFSDNKILLFLCRKKIPPKKYLYIFKKLIHD
tara:strand:- start:196 stop:447 length:252 start_codon:yes stop_codon:yes gene_type:complete